MRQRRQWKRWTAALCALVLAVSLAPGALAYTTTCPDCKVVMLAMPVQPTCIDNGYIQLECPVCHGTGTAVGSISELENGGRSYGHDYGSSGICSRCGDDARPPQTRSGVDPSCLTGADGHQHDYKLMGNMYARKDHEGHKKWVCQTCQAVLMEDVPPLNDQGMARPGSTFRTLGGSSGGSSGSSSGSGSGSSGSATNPGSTTNPGSATNPGSTADPGSTACPHDRQSSLWKYDTVQATCKEEGRYYRTCSQCGQEETIRTIPKASHRWKTEYKAATCKEEGGTVQTCTVCGEKQITNPLPKLEHKFTVTASTPAGVNSAGSRTLTCSVCGEVKTETVAALGGTKESPVTKDPSARAAASQNRNLGNYEQPRTSALYRRPDGNLTRVEFLENSVAVEVYSPDFQLLTSKTISKELEIAGAFFAGAGYNYLIFGAPNEGESGSQEVIRVVKYSKDWERLGAASLRGANTRTPFFYGTLSCTELNGYLYINTAHQMFTSNDGLNHQSNLLLAVRESDMEIIFSRHGVSNLGTGYVSHSFSQFILTASDGSLVTLDNGDSYPRAVVSVRYATGADGTPAPTGSIQLRKFPGSGGTDTGSTLGGFEETSSGFLAVGSYGQGTGKTPVAYSFGKNGFGGGSARAVSLSGKNCFNPKLVKISDSRFLALWNDRDQDFYTDSLSYVFLDGSGNPSGSIQTAKAYLSDCQPILVGGKVIWYATGRGESWEPIDTLPTFYSIDASSGSFTSAGGGAESGTAPGTTSGTASSFTDVPAGSYYADAVAWALGQGVTNGVTPTQFQPNATCTRGQVVTFLWRAKGCPEPRTTVNPFRDVSASSPFYKAILWAQENGITTGVTSTSFNPGGTCTSGHVVTFLWRSEGKPQASGTSALANAYPGQYYTDAVAWADSSGLLTGVGGTFVPSQRSPRANIVTYLYRSLAG